MTINLSERQITPAFVGFNANVSIVSRYSDDKLETEQIEIKNITTGLDSLTFPTVIRKIKTRLETYHHISVSDYAEFLIDEETLTMTVDDIDARAVNGYVFYVMTIQLSPVFELR